ncbi:MAG: hypothetical protein HY951_11690 [Bacteroidia bacterium]|nr:hypothetical protein [Bacteroidia bacterium]
MNLDSFYTYLEQPNTLNSQSLAELSELITRYPYFQSARLLYLKNLHLLNDYRYNDELRVVSAYAGNRKVLYELINENKINSKESTLTFNTNTEHNNIHNISETPETKEIEVVTEDETITNSKDSTIVSTSDILTDIIETKEEEIPTKEENNILPIVTEEINTNDDSEIYTEIAKEKEIITEPINIDHQITEEPILPVTDVIKETPQNNIDYEQIVKDEKVTEKTQAEIPVLVVEEHYITKEKEVVEEIIKKEPVKESLADLILKKVATIHAERGKSKEQIKEKVETIPIVIKEQSFVNQEQLLDEIIAEHKSKVKEVKDESFIVIPEEKKHEEIIAESKPEIEDVTADNFIVITEEEDLTKYDVIQEIEPIKEEVTEIEPVSFTKKFKHKLIVSDEKQIDEIISEKTTEEITNNEIVVSNKDSMFTLEKETTIVKDYPFDEQTPLFTAPAYDINSLLEKEPVLKDSAEIEKTENLEQISMPFEKWLDFISKDTKKVSKPKTNPDLIEAFIKSEPRLSFKIAPENSNLRQKEPLISHNEIELVSESLADIYAKQGLTEKAISMYEKLALQYPEKNIYFANLILKIKEQNSNQ